MENKSLNESIISIRVKLQNAKLKKTGKNKFAGFDYFELADFLPKLNELMLEERMNDLFSIYDGGNGFKSASLVLIKGNEKQEYTMPFVLFDTPVNKKYNKDLDEYIDVKSMQDIQYLGALNTYYKRYLYLNAFGITDGEIIDSMNNEELDVKSQKKIDKNLVITQNQIDLINELFTKEELDKLLPKVNKTDVEELTLVEASNLLKIKQK